VSANDLQTAECNCTTQTCGAGMANANGAVQAALRPIAAVATPANVSAGQSVTLQGAGSAAACNLTIASYSWSVVSGSASIVGGDTDTATVIAPSSGSYTVRLTVTDNMGRQDTADVVVTPSAASTTAPSNAGTNACANGSNTSTGTITVSVSPGTATLQAGTGTQTFTATVSNSSNGTVTWQVNNVTGGNPTVGTISAAGVYSPPASVPSPASVTITAVSVADSTRSASAQVTITAASSSSGNMSGGGGGGGSMGLGALIAFALVLISRLSPRLSNYLRLCARDT
jgi:serine protease